MNRYFHILFLFLLSITAFAQRAPITVTTILTPPYTTSLSTMAESGSTRLMVNLLVNDVTITEIPVKLHIKMESAGITIESIPTQAVRPMFLGGGEARVLTGDDFAEYLRLDNLNFKGLSKDAYVKSGQLPAGLWKFSITVRHFHTNKIISNVGTATAWITSYKPPVLTSPKDGDIAPSNAALPLTFSWQASKHTGGTAAIMYRFEMWERRIEGVPAQAVAASVPPIYTTETAGLTATVLPATLALEPGMKYCWRVTAYDPSGMVTIENNGESEVRTFQYLEKCPEVCGLTVDIKDDTGYASWEENRQHLGGYNFEFYDDEGTCHKTLWGSSNKTAGLGGEYGKTWHVRVQGLCRSGVEGPWSDWVDFKIPDAFKPLKDENGKTYECGMEIPARVITNFELIDNIQKGDTLEDERGTTKYIIHSATKNEDGSFRGLSYMKLSFWGVKVLGEYNNMKVNTDGVIIGRYAWKSVKSDLLVADPEAIEKWADELALEMAGATYNNTIKDTIVLEYSKGYVRFETIRREGDKYFAVTSDNKDVEITSMINGKTRALVKDGDGHELVIDKDGNVMGVEEYKKCGGSAKLMSEYNAHRDSTMSANGNITFSKVKDETYGFDEWRGADYDKDVYDNFNGYRPTYIGAQKSSSIKVAASQTQGIRFINERGVPIIANTADNTLNLTIGTAGKQTVYAYRDSTLVGKLCIQAYDTKEVKVHVVRVNNGKQLELNKIADEVNRIYSSAIVHYTFDELEPITIEYANKQHFVHGGKGTFQNYNADQKAAIKALPESADQNDYYLFFTECYNRLDTAGNVSPEAVNGYMPVGRHYGFIYNEYDNARTIAHELGHGTNSLHHTFSQESESFYTTKETDNLMDYHAGEYLNHRQWQWAHETHRNVLGFLDDEGESEAKMSLVTKEGKALSIDLPNYEKEYCFLTPSLCPIWLKDAEEIRFFDDGTVSGFVVNGTKYSAVVNSDNTVFYCYYDYADFLKLSKDGQSISKLVREQDLNKSKIYTNYTIAQRGTPLFSFVDNSILGVDCKEIISCQAADTIKQLRGAIRHHVLPHNRRTIKYIGDCKTLVIANQYYPEDGLARDFFLMFYDGCGENEEKIEKLVDWCERRFGEYENENCILQRHHISEKFAKKLRDEGITTYEAFDNRYHIGTVLGAIVISEYNLWDKLSDDYNKNTGYNYSLCDLKLRYKILKNGGQLAISILNLEQEGKAAPLTTKSFIDKYGEASSLVAFVLFFELELDLINVEAQTQAINKATRLFKKTPTKPIEKGHGSVKDITSSKFTEKQIIQYAKESTHNPESKKVMLGLFDKGASTSYVNRAGNEYTYFSMESSTWDKVSEMGQNEIWKINKKFIDNQIEQGKTFFFSHDPFSPRTEQYFSKEVEYLIDKGVVDFVKEGDIWKAVW